MSAVGVPPNAPGADARNQTHRNGAAMWPVSLINLSANRERLDNSDHQFNQAGIAYDRLEGVNGWELTENEVARVYDEVANRRRARYPLVRPQIGLYLSHINAWKNIAAGPADGGFVFEDDFAADATLADVLKILSADSADWDMVKLYALKPVSYAISRRPLGGRHEIVIPYQVPITNVAYGLTKDAAERLAAMAIPIFRPCDESHKFFWEKNLRVSLVLPPPVRLGDETAATGTVSATRRTANKRRGWARLRQPVRNFSYQLHYQACLHYYRVRQIWRQFSHVQRRG